MWRSSFTILVCGLAACAAHAAAEAAKEKFEAVPAPEVQLHMQPPEENPPEQNPPAESEPASAESPAPATPAPSTPDYWKEGIEGLNEELDQLTQSPSTAEAPATASAPRSTARSMIQGIVATCAVIAMILVLYYLVNRYGKKTPLLAGTSLGQIMGRVHLGPRASLMFVKVRDRVLVVGVTPTEISRVAEFDASMFSDGAVKEIVRESAPIEPSNPFSRELKKAQTPTTASASADLAGDEWVAAMRQDLDRFQQNLEEFSRDVER